MNYSQITIQDIGVDGVTKEDDSGMAAEEYEFKNDMCTRMTSLTFYVAEEQSMIDLHEHLTNASCCYWGKEINDDDLKGACPADETTPEVLSWDEVNSCCVSS